MKKIKKITPSELSGPRSYFTDIDPNDKSLSLDSAIRNLKLQLLTKQKIIVAASSLFHELWYELFQEYSDLAKALDDGIIIPAIREEFGTIESFFENKQYKTNMNFYLEYIKYQVPWKLQDNAGWFKDKFFNSLRDPNSVLRKYGGFSESEIQHIHSNLIARINRSNNNFLRREDIIQIATIYGDKGDFLIKYAHLLYRLSGARVVNAEGHFPQSNLTKFNITGKDKQLSDDSIFWDIYIETVISYLNSAIPLTRERLDKLTFQDILKIRKSFFEFDFVNQFDRLLGLVKEREPINDPEKLILHMQEITNLAESLKKEFEKRVQSELLTKNTTMQENALWQVANILALIANPTVSFIIGVLSALKSIPEITILFSKHTSQSLKIRYMWMRDFINNKIGWSENQKRSFLEAYKALVTYGLPE